MIAKNNRIEKKLFDLIYKTGVPSHSPFFYSLCIIKKETTIPKFSFVVSKKIAKNATTRNKLKRRGYSVIRKYKDGVNKRAQCLIFLKTGLNELPFKEYEKELVFLLKKAKILAA